VNECNIWQFEYESEILSPNRVRHWRNLYNANKRHEKRIRTQYAIDQPQLVIPATIELTRIAPREYDYDNLVMAFKKIRDVIASLFFPGLSPGQADSNKSLTWIYLQEKGSTKYYAIKISVKTESINENTI